MRGYPELSEYELRTTLRRLAAAHQPDRAALLHRIAQLRVATPVAERQPAGQTLRLAGSALAVATIVGVGGMARWALADGPDPGVVPVAPPAATRAEPLRAAGSILPGTDRRSTVTLEVREPLTAL